MSDEWVWAPRRMSWNKDTPDTVRLLLSRRCSGADGADGAELFGHN